MAFSRSLSNRATLIAGRYRPSFAYVLHEDDRKNQSLNESQSQEKPGNFVQHRYFGTGFSNSSSGFGVLFQDRICSQLSLHPSSGMSFCRYMSTTIGGGADMSAAASAINGGGADMSAAASAVNEVAIAAADSWFLVAALQHVIDTVHSFTGFPWWASIVVTTLLIRGATIPLLINQLKATSKFTLLRPRLEEIKEQMQSKGMDPLTVAEGQKEMKKLFNEYGVTPFSPMKGLFIQGPIFISFFLAISNMAEKVPSFKCGGAYWFMDLTTPDDLYILPVLTALSFLITVECNMQEGMEGNPAAGTIKNVSRVLAALTIPFTMSFPKAIFCYWITSNLFSLTYGLVLKAPGVKKALGVPEIPKPPPGAAQKPSVDLFAALKQAVKQGRPATQESTSLPVEPAKVSNQITSSSSAISQRLKSLERQVKGRKKNKKRNNHR
ncbi:PREDICTED: mitochondrial inner membrane protein OXA1 isoform X1 [Theobroma cacao]|uniref:Mitochondrial inner membrane protein OXA1 isoform X1 n=2 Tax=Theobroma cacao TaxID=3641 RepID=A0AB32W873_THECC|nr:PREDICTED: mitochondrial inner membrane protein OXA1 isoform X1 [Theobroma cacao]